MLWHGVQSREGDRSIRSRVRGDGRVSGSAKLVRVQADDQCVLNKASSHFLAMRDTHKHDIGFAW